jgi:hypothetical protein
MSIAGLFVIAEACLGIPVGIALEPIRSVSVAAAVGATVPTGFLAYQLFYRSYGPVVSALMRRPFARSRLGGEPVTVDAGGVALRHLPISTVKRLLYGFGVDDRVSIDAVFRPEQYFGLKESSLLRLAPLVKPHKHPLRDVLWAPLPTDRFPRALVVTDQARLTEYKVVWQLNREIERALRDLAGLAHEKGVKAQYSRVIEVANTLGASRSAIRAATWLAVAGVAFDLYASSRLDAVETHPLLLGVPLALFVITAMSLLVRLILFHGRQQSFYAALNGLGWGLRSYVVAHPEAVDNLVTAREQEEADDRDSGECRTPS